MLLWVVISLGGLSFSLVSTFGLNTINSYTCTSPWPRGYSELNADTSSHIMQLQVNSHLTTMAYFQQLIVTQFYGFLSLIYNLLPSDNIVWSKCMLMYIMWTMRKKNYTIYGAFPPSFVQFTYMIQKVVLTTSRVYQFSKLKKYLMLYWVLSL